MTDEENTQTFNDWLSSYPQQKTRHAYHNGTRAFLQTVYDSSEKAEALALRYIGEIKKRSPVRDLEVFLNAYSTKPPKSVRLYLVATRQFLSYCCNYEVSSKDTKALRRKIKGSRARTQEEILTKDVIRTILLHSDIRLKALILFLVSSGIRVGEALKLRMNDIRFQTTPVQVYVRGENAKEGDAYSSFISAEAKDALLEWFKVRGNFITGTAYRIHNLKNGRKVHPWRVNVTPPTEDAVFPFSYVAAGAAFRNALQAAGLHSKDKSTGISTIHIHMLRKYFLSQIKTKIPSEVAEALVGHSGYLSDAYRRYSTQQLMEFYQRGESALFILQDTAKIEQLTNEMDIRTKQYDEIVRANAALTARNTNLAADVAEMKARLTLWEPVVKNLIAEKLLQDQRDVVLQNDKEIAEEQVALGQRQDQQALKVMPKSPVKRASH